MYRLDERYLRVKFKCFTVLGDIIYYKVIDTPKIDERDYFINHSLYYVSLDEIKTKFKGTSRKIMYNGTDIRDVEDYEVLKQYRF